MTSQWHQLYALSLAHFHLERTMQWGGNYDTRLPQGVPDPFKHGLLPRAYESIMFQIGVYGVASGSPIKYRMQGRILA